MGPGLVGLLVLRAVPGDLELEAPKGWGRRGGGEDLDKAGVGLGFLHLDLLVGNGEVGLCLHGPIEVG